VPGCGIWLAIDFGCAEITIARPAQHNTLDSRALAGLSEALHRIEQHADVHGTLLRSSVPGVFCSGGGTTPTPTARTAPHRTTGPS
jgi:enoyl-CoA hydratase/carnithine racemase